MNDNFYKHLIEESPTGYAYHKIICDDTGIPCDYEFIEVNVAFEKLTGLSGIDIIGKKITQVLPDIRENKFDWIGFYGDIAINGGKKELEQFSESLNCWYKIYIYSPEKYYFSTHFINISKQINQLSEMELLIGKSEEFLQLNGQKIDYQKISDDFLKMTGAKYATFNLFDVDGKNFTTVAVSGDKSLIIKISYLLGFKIVEHKWDYSYALSDKPNIKTITKFESLSELVGNILPLQLVTLIDKILNVGEVIYIKILRRNTMLGHFVLFMNKKESFDKDIVSELYTRQLGMIISRKRAEDELMHEKILMDALFNSIPGMLYLYNNQNKLVRWNKKHEEITGYSSEELSNMSIMDWFKGDEESQKTLMAGITRANEEGFGDGEANLQKKDGTTVPMYFTGSALYLDGNHYFAGVAIDITDRKKKEEEIFYLSYHDQLTGLPNKRLFKDRLNQSILDAVRSGKTLGVLFLDLDSFKRVNDTMGHAQGDELLKIVSKRLTRALRENDTVCRVGGDEFLILIKNLEVENYIEKLSVKILNIFKEPFTINNNNLFITTSIGGAIYPTDGNDIETLIKNADIAMYKAKEEGKNRFMLCTSNIKDIVIKEMKLTNSLYHALEENELELYYQPQVNILSGEIIGLEALIRWHNKELGLVNPGDFIYIAEKTGLILPIGEWVIRTACNQNKSWQDAGVLNVPIAVNLSVNQIQNSKIVELITKIIKETNLNPNNLELEITENIIMEEIEYIIKSLEQLKQLGVKIAIDDFGTEYSSLNYLKQLPVDKIKIDMSFVRGISINNKDEAIIKVIIALAKNLGLKVIAEGVETRQQLDFLRVQGCDEIQGYYYYKPMPASQIEELMRTLNIIEKD